MLFLNFPLPFILSIQPKTDKIDGQPREIKMETMKGKWALVTGSSRGIGREVACALAGLGCNVIVHARTESNTKDTLDRILDAGGVEAFALAAELGRENELDHLIDRITAATGGVDILYNNAAIMGPWRESMDFPQNEWESVFAVNVTAAARLCTAFIPTMKER